MMTSCGKTIYTFTFFFANKINILDQTNLSLTSFTLSCFSLHDLLTLLKIANETSRSIKNIADRIFLFVSDASHYAFKSSKAADVS